MENTSKEGCGRGTRSTESWGDYLREMSSSEKGGEQNGVTCMLVGGGRVRVVGITKERTAPKSEGKVGDVEFRRGGAPIRGK